MDYDYPLIPDEHDECIFVPHMEVQNVALTGGIRTITPVDFSGYSNAIILTVKTNGEVHGLGWEGDRNARNALQEMTGIRSSTLIRVW